MKNQIPPIKKYPITSPKECIVIVVKIDFVLLNVHPVIYPKIKQNGSCIDKYDHGTDEKFAPIIKTKHQGRKCANIKETDCIIFDFLYPNIFNDKLNMLPLKTISSVRPTMKKFRIDPKKL